MFGETHFRWLFLIALLLAIIVLFWWQDFDGIGSSWRHRRAIRHRERLTGDEFCRRYYLDSEISSELVISFRQFHATFWGKDPELLRPTDDLLQANAGADFAEWSAEVERMFGVELPEETLPELKSFMPKLDWSFDGLLRFIDMMQRQKRHEDHTKCCEE
ncbi:hypothetical protein [Zavarzinella formosa]|uniref:hypothetical protein n=1 Tax=Zavarzinella formosa TaxID=360055 RepID=UPI000317936A|nr:hypothetical protein [Zavarzinella formosa]